MKALIFAAGIGSRLKPWTDSHPKALVEVHGKPMLGRVLDKIIAAGITDIIINVHHFATQIIDYVNENDFDANISFSDETGLLLETGGGLRKIIDRLGSDSVLVHNADILSDFSIKDMIEAHKTEHHDVTLLTGNRTTTRYIVFNSESKMVGWINTHTGQMKPKEFKIESGFKKWAFDGVHIISPSVYDDLLEYKPVGKPFSIMDFYIDFCRRIDIGAYLLPSGAYWFDIGKNETLKAARDFLINK